ncbi:MAG: UDP-N-acetylglucosamine 2-epimerase (non-hydrolyzing) [Bacteroidia bacterium]|nr:UDP-N-acetylglucosamine 2-epimerase (non-hydrolyzing) [Bacteroidia bacterium]
MKITLIAGARPNFMKIAPIIRAIEIAQKNGQEIHFRLVHTGQHYDDKLSKVFFEELGIPEAQVNLGAGSGTQAEQTGKIMIEFEKDLIANPVDLVVVVGDVNSTMACTIVAKKLNTKVAHVEGGIRSFDMAMPEEINRIVTDSLADYFFTTSLVANENLKKTGTKDSQLFFVGNTMIDSLIANLTKIRKPTIWDEVKLQAGNYFVLTLHRPSNVDDLTKFSKLMESIDNGSGVPVIFPVHPRTRKNFSVLTNKPLNIIPVDPLSYLEFIYLIKNGKAVITDSGGVQEETTVLGIPCITLRNNTERPETVSIGTNEMIGENMDSLADAFKKVNAGNWKKGAIPELWDGRTAQRIVDILVKLKL